jgi:5-methylcytosine-specific restriction endonuclease McrA
MSDYMKSRQWWQLRRMILVRDHYLCQLQLEGCLGRADSVDHIMPRERGGASVPENLQAACMRCNRAKAAFFQPGGSYKTPPGKIPPLIL